MKATTRLEKFTKRAKPTSRRKRSIEKKHPPAKSFYDEFKDFIGIIKDGPPDLARNHKLYASGAKKWK